MNKKVYTSPEAEVVRLKITFDVLTASHPKDIVNPEDPGHGGDPGLEGEL